MHILTAVKTNKRVFCFSDKNALETDHLFRNFMWSGLKALVE